MTTQTNTMLDSVKDAFKNFQNMEVPEVAREFVKKSANTAKDRAADVYAGSEKVTAMGATPAMSPCPGTTTS